MIKAVSFPSRARLHERKGKFHASNRATEAFTWGRLSCSFSHFISSLLVAKDRASPKIGWTRPFPGTLPIPVGSFSPWMGFHGFPRRGFPTKNVIYKFN